MVKGQLNNKAPANEKTHANPQPRCTARGCRPPTILLSWRS